MIYSMVASNRRKETGRGKMERKQYEEREKRVYEASVSGSVSSLKQLMTNDPLTLARAAVTCFNETPLHVAAMLGHLDLTSYLLSQKPDMTMAADSRGRSPLHLASANGYAELVHILMMANSDACLIRDEDGRTPLHLAVMKGQVEVARKLFGARPEVIRHKSDLDQGETVLHSAVKQNRLGVLKLLLELLVGGEVVEFLNSKDGYGNTLLHTAAALKQFETVKYLVERPEMEVNAVNENGLTALDIIQHMSRDMKSMEIRECLVKAGANSSCRNMPEFMRKSSITMVIEKPQLPLPTAVIGEVKDGGTKICENKKDWMKKKREALMIVATLIVGMTFQVAVSPPGGVWDEDKTVAGGQNNNKTMLAGTSIFAHYYPEFFEVYMACNTVSFYGSLCMVLLGVSGIPFVKRRILMWMLMIIMWIILTFIASTYSFTVVVISPKKDGAEGISEGNSKLPGITKLIQASSYVWSGVLGIVVLIHTIRFLVWCVRKVLWCARKIGMWVINNYGA